MATLVDKTIDTGGTEDYPTLFAAEAVNFGASNAIITAAGSDEYVICHAICTNGAADTAAVTIFGQTTDATHTITITVDPAYRHPGVWPTSGNVYRNTTRIRVITSNTSLYGIAVRYAAANHGDIVLQALNCTNVRFSDCVVCCVVGAYTYIYGIQLTLTAAITASLYADNCIIYDSNGSATNTGIGFYAEAGTLTTVAYNCTVVDCSVGFFHSGGTATCTNCLTFCTDGFSGTIGGSNNASLNSDAPGTGAQDLAGHAGTEIFRDYANDDFRLLATAPHVLGTGVDLRTNPTLPVTLDIEGNTRPAAFDIGASQVSGLAPAPTVTSITPFEGPPAGGTAVYVAGANYTAGVALTFGGNAASNVSILSAALLHAWTPAHAAGAVTVRATNLDTQYGELAAGFEYIPPWTAPTDFRLMGVPVWRKRRRR